jgi:hypothetical protein
MVILPHSMETNFMGTNSMAINFMVTLEFGALVFIKMFKKTAFEAVFFFDTYIKGTSLKKRIYS